MRKIFRRSKNRGMPEINLSLEDTFRFIPNEQIVSAVTFEYFLVRYFPYLLSLKSGYLFY
jgi:hypothetical protein